MDLTMQFLQAKASQDFQRCFSAVGMAEVLQRAHTHVAVAGQINHAQRTGVMLSHISRKHSHHLSIRRGGRQHERTGCHTPGEGFAELPQHTQQRKQQRFGTTQDCALYRICMNQQGLNKPTGTVQNLMPSKIGIVANPREAGTGLGPAGRACTANM